MTGGPSAVAELRRHDVHWPALDGLRGVAVLAVILFHAYSFSPNGYVGVDVFFALSGFLITALLLREKASAGRISLPNFYMRRILRLYPALVATVVLVAVASAAGGRLADALPGMLAALFYVAHIWIYTGHEALLLEHTWTLSLEEHYYLVWPAVLAGLLGVRIKRLAAVATLLLLAVVLLSPWILSEDLRAAYERAAPMVYGSLAALYWSTRRKQNRQPAWSAAVPDVALILLVSLSLWPVALPSEWMTGWTSAPGALTVLVVLGFVRFPMSLGARALSWSPMRWIGKRAYGLYLYHFPILSLLAHQVPVGPAWLRATGGIGLTAMVAAASYRWLEGPMLRLKDRFRPAAHPDVETHRQVAGGPTH